MIVVPTIVLMTPTIINFIKVLSVNNFILFSNVMIYSEEDYDILMDKYYLIKKYQSRGVRVEIRKMKAGVELNTSFDNSK